MLTVPRMVTVVGTSVLMVVSAAGNITVLTRLVRRKKAGKGTRLDTLLIHLSIADMLVTLLQMPIDIAWSITYGWRAGDFMCRAIMFAGGFGLYLSSFVVICMAVDRYYAIMKPLNVSWEARLRYVLVGAWGCAALASLPQSIIFHTETYPELNDYVQCVSAGMLSESQRLAYILSDMTLLYVLPLLVTVYCSCAIIREVIKLSNPANDAMRRSGIGVLGRARVRTLKMTVIIVAIFIICWTPYYINRLRYYRIDMNTVLELNPMLTRVIWLFTYTNSCANPIVYGIFNRRRKNNAATSQQTIFSSSQESVC